MVLIKIMGINHIGGERNVTYQSTTLVSSRDLSFLTQVVNPSSIRGF